MVRPNRSVVVLLSILTVILVGWVLHVGAAIIQPLVIALLLTVMLQPLVARMARLHIPPWLTVLALVAGLFIGLVQVGLVLQANVAQFLGETVAADPELIDPVLETQEELSSGFDWPKLVDGLEVRLQDSAMPQEVQDLFVESMRELDLAGVVRGVIDGGLGFTSSLMLIMIYMMFIFAESTIFKRKILSLSEDREETQNILENIGKGIQRYLGVKTAVSLMTGSLCYFVLVMLQIPYALLFGLLTFLLNYIPTFGSIIAAIFPTVTALAVEASWSKAVMVIFCYLSVNITLGSVLEPRILGRELNLSPLVIIISVVVWAGLWGVVGAFLAVPITSAIQIVMLNSPRLRPVAILLSIGPPKERDDGGDDGDDAAPAPSAA
ncbi:MAG: AI-2E family transporter [Planctomycetota bacterium]|jgi:predicted PurR-regulated permease PerM